MIEHRFGGSWTDEKLGRVRKYLAEYMQIFSKNPQAQFFRTVYVDAFAGTGEIHPTDLQQKIVGTVLFEYDEDTDFFKKGSAQIALEVDPPFHEYRFIEKDPKHAKRLKQLQQAFPGRCISIECCDANQALVDWCNRSDWSKQRAVVFLDPYGMQVDWSTLAALSATRGVDLWILFPLGQGVNRLLTKHKTPKGSWADRLTRILGTDEWKTAFYQPSRQKTLFKMEPASVKVADFKMIGNFFIQRLATLFFKVAPNPLYLQNSKNIPIYMLCFAASNPKGAAIAVRIAGHLLREDYGR